MKKILILSAIICFFSSVSFAQTDSAKYSLAIKKLMIVSGSENTSKVAINQMIGMMKQQKSDVSQEFLDNLAAELLKTSMPELLDMMVPIYQKHLTLTDVNELIAFYESPIGKKFAEKTPFIMQESMQVGQQWGMKIGQRIAEKLKN